MSATVSTVFLVDDAIDVRHRLASEAAGTGFVFDETTKFILAIHAIEAIACIPRAQSA
ncbi:hypothetical protein LJ655_11470 [Paraburkholderia sp. MMS20-SJTN17]|uniref:Uncharacterized protein n=1 Tax=Paraburkholderia translucens TaxID=2886945 RepID=A0ABS8KCK9_9BURK|nr:hypothetical protein [Paraburkholderia sp. MMS20-SJTN17]MCC8402501.1 hypothetical protein [Paraburkholderia sp. MMS20-SJTN17]